MRAGVSELQVQEMLCHQRLSGSDKLYHWSRTSTCSYRHNPCLAIHASVLHRIGSKVLLMVPTSQLLSPLGFLAKESKGGETQTEFHAEMRNYLTSINALRGVGTLTQADTASLP